MMKTNIKQNFCENKTIVNFPCVNDYRMHGFM